MRLPTLALLLACLLPAVSQAQVYSWKDASGKVHYGDRPPAAKPGETRKLAAPPHVDADAERRAFLERQVAEREKQEKAGETSRQKQEEREEEQKRAENCQRAKANLTAIESGQIRFAVGPDGELKALDGAFRDAELARARTAADEWCAPPAPAAK